MHVNASAGKCECRLVRVRVSVSEHECMQQTTWAPNCSRQPLLIKGHIFSSSEQTYIYIARRDLVLSC